MGYVLSSFHKYKGDDYTGLTTGSNIKFKIYDIYKINRLTGILYFKAFYDKFGINFRYYVTPFFESGSNWDNITAFSIGASVIIF